MKKNSHLIRVRQELLDLLNQEKIENMKLGINASYSDIILDLIGKKEKTQELRGMNK